MHLLVMCDATAEVSSFKLTYVAYTLGASPCQTYHLKRFFSLLVDCLLSLFIVFCVLLTFKIQASSTSTSFIFLPLPLLCPIQKPLCNTSSKRSMFYSQTLALLSLF